MIEVENLHKSYGKAAILRGVTCRASPGEISILTGDNGAGKTTLLRIVAGLARADTGTVRIAGHGIRDERLTAQAHLSFLPQNLAFHPSMTPELLLRFYFRLRRGKISEKQVETLLARVDLVADRRKPVKNLSGGMVQRLGLALLLLPDAPALLLDEPAISLDPKWRRRLSEILREERARGKAILLTTHLPTEWEGEADRHLSCRDGQVFPQDGSSAPDTSESSGGRQ